MAKITEVKLICGDAAKHSLNVDLIMTDPPFDLNGEKLAQIINASSANHLVMLTTMRQLLQFNKAAPEWTLGFDFVFDAVAPKQSKSLHQPNYTHSTGVYFTRNGAKSAFNRKLRQRSDVFVANGYWPTIFHAPKERAQEHGMAKSITAITDLLGSFDIKSVGDPFAGSGTVALAAYELGFDSFSIEKDRDNCAKIEKSFRFYGVKNIVEQ